MTSSKKIIDSFWLVIAAFPVAVAWLLPNHYVPWVTFHTDTAMAGSLTVIGAWILWSTRYEKCNWHWPAALIAMISTVPIMQYLGGFIPFFGAAWINFAYVVGLLLAVLIGSQWERSAPGQCLDFLFLAIGIAALVSVYLAFHQLLRFGSLEDLVMRMNPARPGANLAQPNQLATLFILGLLAAGWGYIRQQLSAKVAIGSACIFLLGEALTLSRTGWLNILLVLMALLLWGLFSRSVKKLWVAVGLGLFFVICLICVPLISNFLLFESNQLSDDRFLVGARPLAWKIFFDAALRQPLWGYGWGQLVVAQFKVALDHPDIGVLFYQSHNLFLDLVLWNGIPIGLFISAMMVWWFTASVRRIRTPIDAMPVLFLLVLGIHAMLEYPLHYAYFLLPAGLVAGQCSVQLGFKPAFSTRAWTGIAVLVLATIVLAITIRDYLRVESSFIALRFEKARVGRPQIGQPPEVLVLTQMREMIRFARVEPRVNYEQKELNWMRQVVESTPSNYGINKLALALAYNNRPAEARQWLEKLCSTSPEAQCASTKDAWVTQAKQGPAFAAVNWPGAQK